MGENGRPVLPPASGLTMTLAACFIVFAAVLLSIAKGRSPGPSGALHGPAEYPDILEDELLELPVRDFQVPPPPFTAGMFPCSQCHAELETDPKPRELMMAHDEIRLRHGERDRWCFDCHDPKNRDKLRLAGGTLVDFSESYRLCGQCHGTIYRDWREGIHGRRTGYWNGPKKYLLCAHCHDPHAPRFKPLRPLPPPVRPDQLRREP